jgi:hypothetical protein
MTTIRTALIDCGDIAATGHLPALLADLTEFESFWRALRDVDE